MSTHLDGDGSVTCLAKRVPGRATEFAALWSPAQPPPPPPQVVLAKWTAAGDIASISRVAIVSAIVLATTVPASEISVTLVPASVIILAKVNVPSGMSASAVRATITNSLGSIGQATSAFGVTVESAASVVVYSPGKADDAISAAIDARGITLTLLPTDHNPVFQAIIAILVLNLFSLIGAWHVRRRYPKGLLSESMSSQKESELAVHPISSAGDASVLHERTNFPLALSGPKTAMATVEVDVSLPTLLARFEVDGELKSFDEASFLRRLATLVGVKPELLNAILSAGPSAQSLVVEVEIHCPDATTLVMAAKTLKKDAAKLGLALGVTLLQPAIVQVPEPPSAQAMARLEYAASSPPASSGIKKPSAAPSGPASRTIQERIPPPRKGALSSRRLPTESHALSHSEFAPLPTSISHVPSVQRMQLDGNAAPGLANMPGPYAPSRSLEGGIQERISMAGLAGASRRAASSLRSRSARVDMNSAVSIVPSTNSVAPPGAAAPTRVLGGLNLTTTAPPSDGIQERLPAMPGLRRRATGEPRRERLQAASVAQALQTCAPPLPPSNDALLAAGLGLPGDPSAAATETVNSRVPRVPAASPPPSPPAAVLPSKSIDLASRDGPGSRALVERGEAAASSTAFEMRLQTHPKVLPSQDSNKETAAKADSDDGWQTWDDRSHLEIIKGIAREHTLVGAAAAFLFGEGPKLATSAQAAQLLWITLTGLLFFSCAQLRFAWLGARWAHIVPSTLEYVDADRISRLSVLCTVGLASALITWPCVLFGRWLFLLANRSYSAQSQLQSLLVCGASWSIIFLAQFAFSVGAINMAGNLDARVVEEDVLIAWLIGALVQWLICEPIVLAVFLSCELLLKWCTTFEELSVPDAKAKNVKSQSSNSKSQIANKPVKDS